MVNASSEEGRLAVNGMSYSGRNGKHANSAIVVAIDEKDYGTGHVLAGMHFQREKQMPKLVRCISGKILDVVCDLRENSDTFGQWKSFVLSDENMKQLLIPGGFAHGFFALENSLYIPCPIM